MSTYTTHAGVVSSIQVNDIRELPLDRWLLALERRLAIVRRSPLVLDDSEEIGNKYTECSWGMCGREVEAWPDAQDHVWPLDFEGPRQRVAPLGFPKGQRCPIDRRANGSSDMNGCFYSCRLFSPERKAKRPTREEAIALYESHITEVRALVASTPTGEA